MGYEKELELAVDIARGASRIILDHYEKDVHVRWKGRNDPVTDADEASTAFILRMIDDGFPGDAVLIEEREDDGRRLASRRTWIVDPLDGTKEFIDRNGEFSVMVGLVDAGRPVLGAVAVPVGGVVYGGTAGGGAFFQEEGGERRPLPARKLPDLSDARLIVSRSHRSGKIDLVKEKLGITSEIACGSVGLKMIKVISGEADLYIHFGRGAKLWDTCAPDAIARAAGIMFTDLTGGDIDYLSPDVKIQKGIVVADARLHSRVISLIADLA